MPDIRFKEFSLTYLTDFSLYRRNGIITITGVFHTISKEIKNYLLTHCFNGEKVWLEEIVKSTEDGSENLEVSEFIIKHCNFSYALDKCGEICDYVLTLECE